MDQTALVAEGDPGGEQARAVQVMNPPAAGAITLWEFFSEAFIPEMGIHLPLKPMHRQVCEEVEAALMGLHPEIWFYLFTMPPRVGKTKLMEAAVCWHYGMFPNAHFIWTSFNNPLACESSRFIQRVINSDWFKVLFPAFSLGDMQQSDNFNTTAGGRLKADGANAMLAGFGAGQKHPAGGAIVIDDPANPAEAMSKIEVDKLQFWLENTIMRRRNSDMWTPIFVSAQRLGGEDLPGYILKNYPGKVRHLKFAGGEIAPGGEKEGRIVSNFPETFTAETLEKMRSVNKYVFHAQIQQEPIVMGGNMIRIEEFRYFTEDVESLKFDWLGLYCDTAWKTKQHNDFSVVGTAGRLAGRCYLLDVRRGKWESPEMVEVIRAVFLEWQARAHRMKTWVRKLLIEDHASGTFAIQKLRSEGLPITAVQRVKDKAQRVEDVLPFIAAGSVLLPQNAAWQNDFLDECASFRKDGKHAHDDMVDMLADAVKDTLGRPLSIFDVMGKRRIR